MNAELQLVAQMLETADKPEDVFGALDGDQADAMRAAYRRLTKVAHPDLYLDAQDQAIAEQAFRALQKWARTAEDKIACGTYGQANAAPASLLIKNRKHSYVVQGTPFAQGDLCNLYRCTHILNDTETEAVFKVARHPDDNDLVANEAEVLAYLATSPEYKQYHPYLPRMLDSFEYRDPTSPGSRRANVLAFEKGHYFTLPEVRAYYTDGIDPRHMAWMWRRLLIVLGFVHMRDTIHGAVVPKHMLIEPEQHGVVLLDWAYALSNPEPGDHIPALAAGYDAWYPPEVLAKETPTPSADLYMGARCMIYLLGGDPVTGAMPASTPKPLQSFFRGVILPKPAQRPNNALTLLDEFTDVIERMWGPRIFRVFYMPTK